MPAFKASIANIEETLHVLCREIGNRLGASDAERRAAHYVADRLRALGLSNVTVESFPFAVWGYQEARVEVLGGERRTLDAIPIANSPATPEDGLEAEVVYVDNATEADLARHDVEGKILLVWGLYTGDAPHLQLLQDCGCVGVLWVDDRFPFDWPVSIGTPFDWRNILRKPQLCISYWDGFKLAQTPGVRVRMISDAWSEPRDSVNVFGDLPGSGDEFVHVGAHIDSVVVGVGAEDDGSGVAAMLEAARMLAELGEPPRRTIRFCGFGAEEQLSEGARRYVQAHPDEVGRTRVMLNLDSMAAITGRNQFMVVGPDELRAAVVALMDPAEPVISGEVMAHVSPFSDMFPFNVRGVPSVFFHRMNQAGTRYFHHSYLDDLPAISFEVIATHANALAHLAYQCAFEDPPFERIIPQTQVAEIEALAAKYFGSHT